VVPAGAGYQQHVQIDAAEPRNTHPEPPQDGVTTAAAHCASWRAWPTRSGLEGEPLVTGAGHPRDGWKPRLERLEDRRGLPALAHRRSRKPATPVGNPLIFLRQHVFDAVWKLVVPNCEGLRAAES
jgi:hypothetical protein